MTVSFLLGIDEQLNRKKKSQGMKTRVKDFRFLTCKRIPWSDPSRGKETTKGLDASAYSARFMVASPRMLALEVP